MLTGEGGKDGPVLVHQLSKNALSIGMHEHPIILILRMLLPSLISASSAQQSRKRELTIAFASTGRMIVRSKSNAATFARFSAGGDETCEAAEWSSGRALTPCMTRTSPEGDVTAGCQ